MLIREWRVAFQGVRIGSRDQSRRCKRTMSTGMIVSSFYRHEDEAENRSVSVFVIEDSE